MVLPPQASRNKRHLAGIPNVPHRDIKCTALEVISEVFRYLTYEEVQLHESARFPELQ